MRDLIEKLRAVDAQTMTFALSTEALVALGYQRRLGHWLISGKPDSILPAAHHDILSSVDALNSVFDQVLSGCGRISGRGRVSESEPMFGCQIFASDLSPDPLEPIGQGEHDVETVAYLIAMLQAVAAKRGAAC